MRSWKTLRRRVGDNWRLIQSACVGIVLLLIGWSLYDNWSHLAALDWKLDYLWFIVSLLLVSAAVLSLAVWWTLSIQMMNGRLEWRRGARIWVFAQLAKYLPGGIWNYASRVVACDRAEVAKSHAAVSLAIETVLRLQAAVLVFLVSLPFWPESDWEGAGLILLVSMVAIGFLALSPRVLEWAMNLILHALGKPAVSLASLKYRHILGLLAGHTFTVTAAGGAFYVMVASVHEVPIQAALPMAGMLAVSVVSGFLNPLTPHGLGTREGVLILLLQQYVPLSVAIVISLLSRVWLTLSEVVGVLITVIFSGLES